MASPMVRYCLGCKRRHRSNARWYGSEYEELGEDGAYWCASTYMSLRCQNYDVRHPAVRELQSCMEQVDNSGCRIVGAKHRYDCTAIMDARVLLTTYKQWAKYELLILLLAAQFYFPWPMNEYVHCIGAVTTRCMKGKLAAIGKRIFVKYASFRVERGRLIRHQTRGIMSTKNPSERRNGDARYGDLLSDFDGTKDLCMRMKQYFGTCKGGIASIVKMLEVLGQSTSSVFDERNVYKNVRCCRILAIAYGMNFGVEYSEWECLRKMSPHVSEVLKTLGIIDWKYVEEFIGMLREKLSEPSYSINDLIVYICLLRRIEMD